LLHYYGFIHGRGIASLALPFQAGPALAHGDLVLTQAEINPSSRHDIRTTLTLAVRVKNHVYFELALEKPSHRREPSQLAKLAGGDS
jgi:hypothetical protein